MKTILKLSLLALGLGVAALPVIHAAKDDAIGNGRHPRLRALLKHRAAVRGLVAKRLDLSKEQIAQLKAERSKVVNALKAIRSDTNLSKEQKRAKARETIQSARNEFRGILTPEQQSKIDKFRERRQGGRAGRI